MSHWLLPLTGWNKAWMNLALHVSRKEKILHDWLHLSMEPFNLLVGLQNSNHTGFSEPEKGGKLPNCRSMCLATLPTQRYHPSSRQLPVLWILFDWPDNSRIVLVGPPGDIKSRLFNTFVSQQCLSDRFVFGPIDQTLVNITKSTWKKDFSIILRDTTGAEEVDSLRRYISGDADALIVAFSAQSNKLSLDELFEMAEEDWLEELMLHHSKASLILVAVHTTRPDPYQRMGSVLKSRVLYTPEMAVTRILALQCSLDFVESVTNVFAKVSSRKGS